MPAAHTAAAGSVLALRSAPEKAITVAEREQLIADARAGKLVRVEMDALVYVQRATPNRNLVRFREGLLTRLARSFKGAPMLRDHEQGNLAARGGRVIASEIVKDGHGLAEGEKAIRQTLELVEPWAVEAALRGTIDRFSIGWHSTGDTVCSICGEAMSRGWFFVASDCEHDLGQEYDGQVCQLEYTEAEGIEVSAVTVPAVVGTEVEDIRAALAAARQRGHTPGSKHMDERIVKALGLAEGASEAQVLAEIERQSTLLGAVQAANRRLGEELATAQAELGRSAKVEHARRVESLRERGRAEGKLIPGSDTERRVLAIAETQLELAEGLIKDLPPATPVGQAPQAAGPDPTPRGGTGLSDVQRHVNAQLGITAEMHTKFAPKPGALTAGVDEE